MTERPRRYAQTVFTAQDVNEIQKILNLPAREDALFVATRLQGAVERADVIQEAKCRHQTAKSARLWLERVHKAAALLGRELGSEPRSVWLIGDPEDYAEAIDLDAGCDRELAKLQRHLRLIKQVNKDKDKLEVFISLAREIEETAFETLSSDESLREFFDLPKRSDANSSVYASALWPELFAIWAEAGQYPGKGEGGPLHRFISFVHKAFGLPPVPAATLKTALTEWQPDRPKTFLTELCPVDVRQK